MTFVQVKVLSVSPLQPLSRIPRHVTFEDEEIVRINPRERSWERSTERYLGRQADRSWNTGYEDYRHAIVRDRYIHPDETESYVHFDKTEAQKHDYTYPLAPSLSPSDSDPALGSLTSKGHSGSYHQPFSSVVSSQPRSFFTSSSPSSNGRKGRKDNGLERAQCEHCGEAFYLSENRRGRCQDAPDPLRVCIRRVSCMWLADTMLYHCMSDPEGEYSDPCSCDGGEGSGGGRLGTRWLALLGLSAVAPCLCLYPPLHACHRVGLACGCCGGRHKAQSWDVVLGIFSEETSEKIKTLTQRKRSEKEGWGKSSKRRKKWSRLFALLPWFFWVSLQIPDTEISQIRKKNKKQLVHFVNSLGR